MFPKRLLAIGLFAAAIVAHAGLLRAQWMQTSLGNGYHVGCFAVIDSNLFAGTDSGVFRSTDNGTNWSAMNSGIPILTHVNAFIVNGSTIFAGTDTGVFLSTNNGTNWVAANNGLIGNHARTVTCLAREVTADGHDTNLFVGTAGSGVFLSTNDGATWNAIDTGISSSYNVVTCFAVKVSNDGRDTNLFAGTYSGVYISTNSGQSWTVTSAYFWNGLDDFAASGTNLFAGVFSGGAFRSTDDGTIWTLIDNGLTTTSSSNILSFALYVSPDGGDTDLFAGTGDGVYLSTNNGTGWRAENEGLSNIFTFSVAIAGTNPSSAMLFAGTDTSGVWRLPLSQIVAPNSVSQTSPPSPGIQSYPNPFSQRTTISFTSESQGYADVRVVNLLGVSVAPLYSGELSAGEHTFAWDARGFAPGMYECVVRMNGRAEETGIVVQ